MGVNQGNGATNLGTAGREAINEVAHTYGKGLNIALWTMQILAAAAFLMAGGAKLASSPQMVEVFEIIGVGQWFRYVTGLLEVLGAIGLLVPRTAFYGASLLVAVMCGALAVHATVLGLSGALPPFLLLLLTGAIAYLRRSR